MIRIFERRDDAGRAGLAIEQRTDEDDPSRDPLAACADGNRDLLPFPDCRQVGRRNRKVDPHFGQIDHDEQFAFLALPADQRTEIDATFGDPAGDRRAQFLPSERRDWLIGQSRDLLLASSRA